MKICLVGPSCVGKTTLAYKIKAFDGDIKILNLDLVYVDTDRPRGIGEFFYRSKDEGIKLVEKFMKENRSWIIEGVFPVERVFDEADVIFYLKPFFLVSLMRQWYRYLTDEYQRKTFGFKTNITSLTPDIIVQYFSKRGCKDLDDPLSFSVSKYEKILKNYKNKLVVLGTFSNFEIKDSMLLKKSLASLKKNDMR